jgi:hypothetical protein
MITIRNVCLDSNFPGQYLSPGYLENERSAKQPVAKFGGTKMGFLVYCTKTAGPTDPILPTRGSKRKTGFIYNYRV